MARRTLFFDIQNVTRADWLFVVDDDDDDDNDKEEEKLMIK